MDYLKAAEAVFVETDARTLQAMYGGESRMRGLKKALLLALLCIPLLLCRGSVVYASQSDSIENDVDEGNNNRFGTTSPWLKGTSDESIYGIPLMRGKNSRYTVGKPGRVEKYIAELLRNIGSSVITLLQDNIGASLDSIVYGRVGSGQPNKVKSML